MANCDGIPSRSQPITLSRKLFVCSCVIGPVEKRMKSSFAINSASRSRSSAANGRRIKRGVSSFVESEMESVVAIFQTVKLQAEIIAQSGNDVWALAPVPATNSLSKVAAAAKECTACPLYKNATQTVFGEGPKHATMLMIGEQPGDYEDVAGKPFVGPAGKILNRALEDAGVDRDEVYVTNE